MPGGGAQAEPLGTHTARRGEGMVWCPRSGWRRAEGGEELPLVRTLLRAPSADGHRR